MSTQRDERVRQDEPSGEHARTSRFGGAWALALLLAAPFVTGAKGCDRAVVGDECPRGTAAAKSAHCGGDSGAVDAGHPPAEGGPSPVVSCGGLRGVGCPAGEYCNFPASAMCGAADQTGTCAPSPEVCTEQYAPVCGCDGKTYGNACSAAGAGVSVAHAGACTTTTPPPTGGSTVCGGLRGATCGKGQYCEFPVGAQCGAADQTGTCTDIPQICDLVYHAVCGCDGMTYGNDCDAASHGVSVASDGPCPRPVSDAGAAPSSCGGLVGATCATGEYCNFGSNCGAADQTGTCVTMPQICDDLAMPVCGCDGKTYANGCYAARAGVSVQSQGACATPPTPKTCGGLVGGGCAKGEYCDFPLSARCGIADGAGTCAAIPAACTHTQQYAPVCGCDGKTYGDACSAAGAGVSVASTGACP